jgi:hypothetical protein
MAEVYFPVHRYLRPENDYLERAALVYMIAGAPIPAVQQAIPRVIQQELRLNPEAENHFQVLSARASPFLIICLGPNIRDAIVANSPFEIPELEAEFGAVEWSLDWGMIIQRPTRSLANNYGPATSSMKQRRH